MTAGLLNKAKRGDLALKLPVGLTRNDQAQVLNMGCAFSLGAVNAVIRKYLVDSG